MGLKTQKGVAKYSYKVLDVDFWSVFLNITLNTGSNSRSSAAVQRGLTLGPGSPTPRSPGSPGSPERP